MVVFHGLSNYYESEIGSGYSLDNIPPDPTRAIVVQNRNGYLLQWEPIETGTIHGNSYDELNGIWYKIYAGDNPHFICDENSFLQVISSCSYPIQSEEIRQFYKIIVSDTP